MKDKNYPNLKPWKAGQSGNPAGRKVGSKNVSTIVRELLEQDAVTDLLISTKIADMANGKPTSYAQAIVLAMLRKALEGNVQAVCWLAEQHGLSIANETGEIGLFNSSPKASPLHLSFCIRFIAHDFANCTFYHNKTLPQTWGALYCRSGI